MLVRSHTTSQMELPIEASAQSFTQIRNEALHHLVAWWFEKRGERLMPALCDVKPVEIRSALSQIWLCEYLPQGRLFRYRLAGEEINDFWGLSLRGKYLDEILTSEQLVSAKKKCRMAIDLPAIVYDRLCLSLTKSITRHGERIVLPLSDDGRTVTALLGATYRDWFRDLEFDPLNTLSETTRVAVFRSQNTASVDRDWARMNPGQQSVPCTVTATSTGHP